MRHLIRVAAVCCAFTLLPLSAWPDGASSTGSPDPAYAAGVAAARDGDFAAALRHFQAARAAGMDTPTLSYNLGVAGYRLERMDTARAAFTELLARPRWQALAHYNLGLVEERAGQAEAARYHFQRARALAGEPALEALATRKLEVTARPADVTPRSWHGVLSLAAGYDDNVVLSDDLLLDEVSREDDYFGEALAAAQCHLAGEDGGGPTLGVGAYYRAHADLGDFDFGGLSATLLWQAPLAGWQLSTGFQAEAQFSGGHSYANAFGYRLALARQSGRTEWELRNELGYVAGASRFDYVSGWRNRTRLQLTRGGDRHRLRAGYEIELNDRDDLARDPEFFSYSPRRQTLYASLRVDVARRLTLEGQGSVRISDYPDDNRYFDTDGILTEAPRDQDGAGLGLRADYRLDRRWNLWASVDWIDSDSDIARYDYSSTRWLIGLETLF